MAVHIHGFRDGTVAERLNLPTIRGLPVALPPLAEQQSIAHILGSLDDKIENQGRYHQIDYIEGSDYLQPYQHIFLHQPNIYFLL